MNKKLALTLTALSIGLLGATANAQYAPAKPGVRHNVVDKRRPIVRNPAFNGFPAAAVQGEYLTVTGRWLPANAVLYIGSKRIAASHATARKLTFMVPAHLRAGKYNAKLVWGRASRFMGRIAIKPAFRAPIVHGIAKTATLGKSLTITGRWLPAGAVLKLGRYTLRPTYATANRMTFKVPAHLATSRYRAKLVAGRFAKNLGIVRLVAPNAVITSVPNRAVLGKNLTIYGRWLPSGAVLKIGNKQVLASYASPTKLTFTVPRYLRAGVHSMKLLMAGGNKNLGRIRLAAPYYKPVVRWSPSRVTAGKYLTITGHHLPANAVLKIGGYRVKAYSASSTKLTFKVPRRLRGYYSMFLMTGRENLSLGRLRVAAPRRAYRPIWSWYFDWNGFIALR